MLPHIELDRTFWPLGDGEEFDPDTLRARAAFESNRQRWSDLLEMTRVVILAEGGTGKTHELQEMARRLRGEGKVAFFCRIEELADNGFENALEEGNAEEFRSWLGDQHAAWFFLDSVDEARLANPQFFERALRALARNLHGATSRAHIFITARVSDWRATSDLQLVRDVLPPPATGVKVDPPMEKGQTGRLAGDIRGHREGETHRDDVQVVQLVPLTTDQMQRFAAGRGMHDVEAFINAIERTDSTIFAERPQDLLDLIAYWNEYKKIGTLAEMIAFNIEKKLLEPNLGRDARRSLPQVMALKGAMLLAAGQTFTRKNSIVLPDMPIDPTRALQAIDARELLPDWHTPDIQTLLSRALFDEATYGRVRFHHRSVREYLTAQWLWHLLKSGKSRREIEGLLFARRYGIDVAVPSMQPIAAWLALWDDWVRNRIFATAPEILIEHGDPSYLPVETRSRLLRQFASLNEGREDSGASFDIASIRRLADPALAATVLDLLDRCRGNEDVRHLLLRIVWQGQIADCAASALSFALDTAMDSDSRIYAIWSVGAAGNKAQKRRLAKAVLANPSDHEVRVLGEIVRALFPNSLTTDELLDILEAVESPPKYAVNNRIESALEQIVNRDSPRLQQEALLAGLVGLLEREPHIEPGYCQVSQRYVWLLSYTAKLAERIILNSEAQIPTFHDAVLRALELEAQTEHDSSIHRRLEHHLEDLVRKLPTLRYALFWRAVERRREELSAGGKRLTDWRQALLGSPVLQLELDDFEVFLTDVQRRTAMDDRLVALTAAFSIWGAGGRGRIHRERMWRAVKGQPELEAKLHGLLHPGPMSQKERRYRSLRQARKRRHARRKARQEQARQKWIVTLRGNIDRIRLVNEATLNPLFGDLFYLGQEIAELSNSSSQWKWDRWDLLEAEFGREIAEAVRDGLMAYWRLFRPGFHSDQDAKGRQYLAFVELGLIGLAIEVRERADWTRHLSVREAQHACRYMLCDPNGLPDWTTDLMSAQPETFDRVMVRELSWQFEQPADVPDPFYVISALCRAPEPICERYCPFIFTLLEQKELASTATLENTLALLLKWNDLDQSAFTNLARQRYEISQDEGRRLTWLVAWLCVEADGALEALCAWLDDAEDTGEATRRMIAFCNALLEHREMRFGSPRRDFERIDILGRFVPLIYRHVRIEEDNIHEDAYSPDARDHAETTRSYLLGRVCETSGRATFDTLMAFSRELPHERLRQRMVVLARRRAAEDAEQTAWLASDVLSFAEQAERLPHSARDLFDLVCSRLDDLRLDLEEGDASEARILRRVDQETEIRTWFANRLRQATRGRYSVPPEEELADASRPDLRIHAPAVDAPVSIELKIADKWSYSQLSERLRNQLVGQYLRDIRSRFGIFLLVWRGKQKHWRNHEVGKVTFGELLKRLEVEAVKIPASRKELGEIMVIGIDLTRRDSRHETRR